jgi:hypothetical protein
VLPEAVVREEFQPSRKRDQELSPHPAAGCERPDQEGARRVLQHGLGARIGERGPRVDQERRDTGLETGPDRLVMDDEHGATTVGSDRRPGLEIRHHAGASCVEPDPPGRRDEPVRGPCVEQKRCSGARQQELIHAIPVEIGREGPRHGTAARTETDDDRRGCPVAPGGGG